eukprot:TRINITY_DN50058_c0_g1_i1.p1 TRINITY_DN50058_c0_g1~~TRINITY_DN50058_c0_g1_i1.p1  ORF type:complete len:1282 (+),score=326.71 TRINITY_DN50058_c0_g1_i1:167-3847(+)
MADMPLQDAIRAGPVPRVAKAQQADGHPAGVSFRVGSKTSAPKYNIPNGKEVELVAADAEWATVRYHGLDGWVKSRNLRAGGTPGSTPSGTPASDALLPPSGPSAESAGSALSPAAGPAAAPPGPAAGAAAAAGSAPPAPPAAPPSPAALPRFSTTSSASSLGAAAVAPTPAAAAAAAAPAPPAAAAPPPGAAAAASSPALLSPEAAAANSLKHLLAAAGHAGIELEPELLRQGSVAQYQEMDEGGEVMVAEQADGHPAGVAFRYRRDSAPALDIPNGTKLTVIAQDRDWALVEYKNKQGHVKMRNLKRIAGGAVELRPAQNPAIAAAKNASMPWEHKRNKVVWVLPPGDEAFEEVYKVCIQTMGEERRRCTKIVVSCTVADAVQECCKGDVFFLVVPHFPPPDVPEEGFGPWRADLITGMIMARDRRGSLQCISVSHRELPAAAIARMRAIPSWVRRVDGTDAAEAGRRLEEQLRMLNPEYLKPALDAGSLTARPENMDGRRILIIQMGDRFVRAGIAGLSDRPQGRKMPNNVSYQRHCGGSEVGSFDAMANNVCFSVTQYGQFADVDHYAQILSEVMGQFTKDGNTWGGAKTEWAELDAVVLTEPAHGDDNHRTRAYDMVEKVVAPPESAAEHAPTRMERLIIRDSGATGGRTSWRDTQILPAAVWKREVPVELVIEGERTHRRYHPLVLNKPEEVGPPDESEVIDIIDLRLPGGQQVELGIVRGSIPHRVVQRAVYTYRQIAGVPLEGTIPIYLCAKEPLSLYHCGSTDGIVVSMGESYTRIVAIRRGTPVLEATQMRHFAAGHIKADLRSKLACQYGNLDSLLEHCYVLTKRQMTAVLHHKGQSVGHPWDCPCGQNNIAGKEYKCPACDKSYMYQDFETVGLGKPRRPLPGTDGKVVANMELWNAPEKLFTPDVDAWTRIGDPTPTDYYSSRSEKPVGLPEMVRRCVAACPPDIHHYVCRHIIMDGGCSMIRGLPERLQEELWPDTYRDAPEWKWRAADGGALPGGLPELVPEDHSAIERAFNAERHADPGATDAAAAAAPGPTYLRPALGDGRIFSITFTLKQEQGEADVTECVQGQASPTAKGKICKIVRVLPEDRHPVHAGTGRWHLLSMDVVAVITSFLEPLQIWNIKHEVDAFKERDIQGFRGGSLLMLHYAKKLLMRREGPLPWHHNGRGIGALIDGENPQPGALSPRSAIREFQASGLAPSAPPPTTGYRGLRGY